MYILVGILLIIVIIFGVSSGMQSYATAQQAQATIEVAQVAQISSYSNLVTILTIVMLVVIAVALLAVVLYILYKRSTLNGQESVRVAGRPMVEDRPHDLLSKSQISVNELTQLMMLDMLRSMRTPALKDPTPGPSPNGEGENGNEPFGWLR